MNMLLRSPRDGGGGISKIAGRTGKNVVLLLTGANISAVLRQAATSALPVVS
jgi:hypothetical protein